MRLILVLARWINSPVSDLLQNSHEYKGLSSNPAWPYANQADQRHVPIVLLVVRNWAPEIDINDVRNENRK